MKNLIKFTALLLFVILSVSCEQERITPPLKPDYKYWVVGSVDFDGTEYAYDIEVNLDYTNARVSDESPENDVLDNPLSYQDCNLQDTIWLVSVSEIGFMGVFINDAYHNGRIYYNDQWHDSQISFGTYSYWRIPNTIDFIATDYMSFTWVIDENTFDCSEFKLPIVVSDFSFEKIENDYHFYITVPTEINTDRIYILGSNDGEDWTNVVEIIADERGEYHLIYKR